MIPKAIKKKKSYCLPEQPKAAQTIYILYLSYFFQTFPLAVVSINSAKGRNRESFKPSYPFGPNPYKHLVDVSCIRVFLETSDQTLS